MARAKHERTRFPGVYKRKIHEGRQTVYDIQYRQDGKVVWIKGRYTNLQAAADERARIIAELKTGGAVADRQRTFGDFAENVWLPRQKARVEQGKLRSSTLRNYERDLTGVLLPAFRDTRLHAITVEQAQGFADQLSADGKANWTVIRLVNALSSVLTLARTYRLITFNPVDSIEKPPAQRRREPHPLTIAEVHKLADASPTADARNLILVAAFTGARMGELFGLRWANVSLEPEGEETMLISEQAYQGERVDRPKTPTGRRLIHLAPQAVEALRAQHVESKRENPFGLVFPSPEGSYQRQSNFTRREWATTRESADLPGVVFHDLRHFFVSHARNAGLPSAVTEQLVGHSDERTHRGYTHALPGTEAMIREALAEAFK